ncbi:MAG: transporter, family, 4-hydroxybenzoate transporter, partial [Pseudonocardiales bacterium]|nr:transporter, family, 4-hydroxybenzoate transporter [Pseudonocardiales bacterium]
QAYPVQARATGQGMMIGIGRWGAVLGPYIGGALLGASGSKDSLFIVVAGVTVLAIIGLVAIRTDEPDVTSSGELSAARPPVSGLVR